MAIFPCFVCEQSALSLEWLKEFASTHELPLIKLPTTIKSAQAQLVLRTNLNGELSLSYIGDDKHSFYIDFDAYHSLCVGSSIVRFSKIKHHQDWHVCDATAGLGRDAFVMGQYADKIVLLEHNPIVYALLYDAFTRAAKSKLVSVRKFYACATILCVDSIDYLNAAAQNKFDMIYLDPMFTHNKRLTKKPMQFLRTLVGVNTDNKEKMLACAVMRATCKVIAKRHKKDSPIARPIASYCNKNFCFDLYNGNHEKHSLTPSSII